MQFVPMSAPHDSTIDEEGDGLTPLPITSTPAPSDIPSSSTRLPWRSAEHHLRNPRHRIRTTQGARPWDFPDEVRLQPQSETSKQILHLVHDYDPRLAIVVRAPTFGKTQEVMLVDPTTVTYDKLKRSVEEVFLIDETYGRGGNIHIADRDTVEEIERMYLKRCAGKTSEVIEVHEGNVKAVIKLLGTPIAFRELCVEFGQSIGANTRHAEKTRIISNEKETEKKQDERTLGQTSEVGKITSDRGVGCSACGSFQSHQPVARPFPDDSWDK